MRLLESFLDTDVIALDDVAYFLRHEDDAFDDAITLEALVELGTRLPSGLVYAEGIWIVSEPPPGIAPLAAGSPWYAVERSLAVVMPAVRSRLVTLLVDLARHHAIAARVLRDLGPRPDLVEALLTPELAPGAAAELAMLLDAPPSLVAELDAHALGLRTELAVMATRAFQPVVRLHATLRVRNLRRRGARLVEALVARLPDGPFRVALSDGPMLLEPLSPYVRDLAPALATWALENPARISTSGLVEALGAVRAPSADLAALVVPDLFAHAPQLVAERRRAERAAGLDLVDDVGAIAGWAELSRLAAPDAQALGPDPSGTLVVLAAAGEDLLVEAARGLLSTGRVIGLAMVLRCGLDVEHPVVADGLASDDDGAALTQSGDVADRAARIGIELLRPGTLGIDDDRGAPRVALELVALARRAKVLGRLPDDAPVAILFHPRGDRPRQTTLSARQAELSAAKVALGVLSQDREDTSVKGRVRRPASQNAPGVSRRFRA